MERFDRSEVRFMRALAEREREMEEKRVRFIRPLMERLEGLHPRCKRRGLPERDGCRVHRALYAELLGIGCEHANYSGRTLGDMEEKSRVIPGNVFQKWA